MTENFGRAPATLPLIIVVGPQCAWRAGGNEGSSLSGEKVQEIQFAGRSHGVFGSRHGGQVEMPSGQVVQPAPLAFSAAGRNGDVFFAVASSEIWRQVFPQEEAAGIPNFIRGIAVHELVHTQQAPVLKRLAQTAESQPTLSDLDDDFIERTFGASAEYAAAMEAQKASLIEAIRATTVKAARQRARVVLEQYRNRQDAYFAGEDAPLAALEDDFLTMEGVAVWFTFQLFPPEGAAGGSPAQIADYYEPRSGGAWVQSHGGLFAALLDRIDTDWRRKALDGEPTLVDWLAIQADP